MDKVKTDIVIIGAGVIGLSIAYQASLVNNNIIVLEKNDSIAQETSSRNSEVIHAGIYYKQDSLKAISCVKGRELLYDLCSKNNIKFKKTGKIIIAKNKQEEQKLFEIKENALKNSVELQFLSAEEVKKLEPDIKASSGLYSKETGIVDSHALMEYFYKEAKANDVDIVFDSEVKDTIFNGTDYDVIVDNAGENICVQTKKVINCAGNNADDVARKLGIDINRYGYEQYFLKGNYFRLKDKYRNTMRHLVYPVPLEKSLGIHTVVDREGGLRLGPDEEKVDVFDYKVDARRRKMFFDDVKEWIPFLKEEDIVEDFSGIRPKLVKADNSGYKDFIINEETDKGFPGFINLIGIESPGLTASVYIGQYIMKNFL